MGQDAASGNDTWGYFEPRASRSLLGKPGEDGFVRLFVPRLQRGLGYRADIETSVNGGDWQIVSDVR